MLKEFAKKRLTWHTAVSVDIGKHDELLDEMAAAGCKSLFIGFETINQNNLKGCSKKQNKVEEYNKIIEKIHDRGMMVNASIVLGFDHDDKAVFKNTLEWLVAQKVESMTAHILTPYPGTLYYQQLLEEERIVDFDLTHYNTSRAVYKPKNMSPQELEQGYLWMYSEFYSWKRIYQRYPKDPRRKKAYLAFNLLYRKLGKLMSLFGRFGMMRLFGRIGKIISYPRSKNPPTRYANSSKP